jgi:hypothetical protein
MGIFGTFGIAPSEADGNVISPYSENKVIYSFLSLMTIHFR